MAAQQDLRAAPVSRTEYFYLAVYLARDDGRVQDAGRILYSDLHTPIFRSHWRHLPGYRVRHRARYQGRRRQAAAARDGQRGMARLRRKVARRQVAIGLRRTDDAKLGDGFAARQLIF